MRILYFGSYDRGVGRNAILAEGLRLAGAEVLECHAPVWRDTAAKLAAGRHAYRLGGALLRQGWAWLRLAQGHARLAGAYDVLLVGATAHPDLPLAKLLARRAGRPLVFDPLVSALETVRDRRLLPPGALRLAALGRVERLLFGLPDLVLADTATHAATWRSELGVALPRIAVIPAGAPSIYRRLATPYRVPTVPGRIAGQQVDLLDLSDSVYKSDRPNLPDQPNPPNLPDPSGQPFRILYFGQYIPLHGLGTVIQAAHLLRDHRSIELHLVGTGQTLPEVSAQCAALRLANVHIHAHWLAAEDLAEQHIARANLCLGIFGGQPKASSVVPYKVYTALAAGRPVLTADTPAVRELLGPGQEVWTVPAADPAALASAILDLQAHPTRLAQLAAAGQAAYDSRFAPLHLGRRLLAALQDLCGSG